MKPMKTERYQLLETNVRFLVVHCSATRSDRDYTVGQLRADHLARGFREIGYHFYIRRNGAIVHPRPLGQMGAHALHYNRCSIGICYEGGLDADGRPCDTRTEAQKEKLLETLEILKKVYPQACIVGHYQLSRDIHKACPCFNAAAEYSNITAD